MPSKNSLNNVNIPVPCDADWNSMRGNDQVRFCAHCNLSVHNLSQMTRSQAERLVNKSKGRLCVRYYPGPNGLPRTLPLARTLHRIGRRASRVAAGAFTATLSITSAAAQNSITFQPDDLNRPQATQTSPQSSNGASIVGTISDQNGAVIPGATISLSNDELHVSFYISTSWDGQFRIDGLQVGYYQMRIEAPGFAAQDVNGFYVSPNGETRIDRTLQVASIEANVDANTIQEFSVAGGISMIQPKDPFIRAVQEDNLEKVTELIAGRNVNLRDEATSTTALEHAVRNADREMVQLLLAAGADVNAKDGSGETVLMMLDGDATSDLIWDLINAGAKVNLADAVGNTALMRAADVDNPEAVRTLLDAGAEVDAATKLGRTALMVAAASGSVNIVRALVFAGANINAIDEDGANAMSLAVENEHAAVIRLLKSKGALATVALKARQ